jgi:hypothetical protein
MNSAARIPFRLTPPVRKTTEAHPSVTQEQGTHACRCAPMVPSVRQAVGRSTPTWRPAATRLSFSSVYKCHWPAKASFLSPLFSPKLR